MGRVSICALVCFVAGLGFAMPCWAYEYQIGQGVPVQFGATVNNAFRLEFDPNGQPYYQPFVDEGCLIEELPWPEIDEDGNVVQPRPLYYEVVC